MGDTLRPLVQSIYKISSVEIGRDIGTFNLFQKIIGDIPTALSKDASALLKSGKRSETIKPVVIKNPFSATDKQRGKDAYFALVAMVVIPSVLLLGLTAFVWRSAAARIGDIVYWVACVLAGLYLGYGWIVYRGVDTTGIELARQHGYSDTQILSQRKDQVRGYDEALKEGYSATEILDHIVERRRSYDKPALITAASAAFMCWAVGLGVRSRLRRNARRKAEQECAEGRRHQQPGNRTVDPSKEDKKWWNVLQVSRDANASDIRRSYLRIIQQYHPDRLAGLAPELVELAERRSKTLNAAYAEALHMRGEA
jgi:DnaJ domain